MVDLFLRFNKRLVFAVQRVPHELSINESHVLMEIGFCPGILAKQICKLLNLDKSIVSRTISRLEKRGFCKRLDSNEDRRGRLLELSQSGKLILEKDSLARNEMALQCVLALNSEELKQLCNYLDRIADSLKAYPIKIRSGDEPIKVSIRRLTRSMGFLGDNVLSTGMPIEKLQILYNLYTHSSHLSMERLRDALPYELSALSRLLSELKSENLIAKKINKTDRRKLFLSLTKKGLSLIVKAIQKATRVFSIGLHDFSQKDSLRLIELLEIFLMIPDFIAKQGRDRSLIVRKISSEEREKARIFIVESFVKQKRTGEIPAVLIDQSSLSLGLYKHHKLIGLCELNKINGVSRIEEIFVFDDNLNKESLVVLFERALFEGFKFANNAKVLMPLAVKSATSFETLSDPKLSDGNHLVFTTESHTRIKNLIK